MLWYHYHCASWGESEESKNAFVQTWSDTFTILHRQLYSRLHMFHSICPLRLNTATCCLVNLLREIHLLQDLHTTLGEFWLLIYHFLILNVLYVQEFLISAQNDQHQLFDHGLPNSFLFLLYFPAKYNSNALDCDIQVYFDGFRPNLCLCKCHIVFYIFSRRF
jgi:hypothetical protein